MLAPSNRPKSRLRRTLSAALSLWERAGARVRSFSLREEKKKNVLSSALSPLPNPLPEGEGVTAHRPLLTALPREISTVVSHGMNSSAGRARLSTLLALATLLLALSGFALVHTRAGTPDSSPSALSPSPSLAWLSDRAWLHPSRVGSSPFALGSLPLFASTLSPLEPMFATTYTWTQANSTDFTDAGNWTPNRTPLATSDVLVFNGAFTPTATVTNIPSQTIGELHAQGNVTANLTPAAGVVALSIAGGVAAIDLEVASGSALNITGGTTTTNTLLITLGVSAIGSISGNMTFSGAQHSLQAANATGITFNSGATFTQGTGVTGSVFGSGTSNSIVFASGSTFNQLAGSNPFQKAQPASVVVFQTGSLFSLQANLTPSFSGRTYANFELNSAAASPVVTGGNAVSIDNLTITAGTLNFNMTG